MEVVRTKIFLNILNECLEVPLIWFVYVWDPIQKLILYIRVICSGRALNSASNDVLFVFLQWKMSGQRPFSISEMSVSECRSPIFFRLKAALEMDSL